MRKVLFSIFVVFYSLQCFAQESIPIGQWRIHLPYNSVKQLVETPKLLYVVGEVGFYSFDKLSGEIELYSKVNGFSDTEVAALAYSETYNSLVIGYKNTNVDLLKDGRVINIQGILRKSILGKKEINEIQIEDNLAYIACSFGVVVVDLISEDIKDSYLNIGPAGTTLDIYSIQEFNDSLYIGTPDGIYSALISNQVNLSDFSSWKLTRPSSGASMLREYQSSLHFVEDSILYTYSNNSYGLKEGGQKFDYKSIALDHNKMVVCKAEGITVFDNQGV